MSMSEEEKKAIAYIENEIKDNRNKIIEIEHKNDSSLVGYGTMHDIYKLENWYYSILLNLIEKQQKELKPIHKLGIPVETVVAEFERLEDLEDDTDCLKYRIEELEKENEELKETQKILQHNYTVAINEEQQNSIPKSVIRKKIEELKEIHKEQDWTQKQGFYYDCYNELLGGSNENS